MCTRVSCSVLYLVLVEYRFGESSGDVEMTVETLYSVYVRCKETVVLFELNCDNVTKCIRVNSRVNTVYFKFQDQMDKYCKLRAACIMHRIHVQCTGSYGASKECNLHTGSAKELP